MKNAYASFGYNIVDIEYEVTKKDETDQFVDVTFNIKLSDELNIWSLTVTVITAVPNQSSWGRIFKILSDWWEYCKN